MPNRPVRELIERDHLVRAGPQDSVRRAAKVMAEQKCGCILVMEGELLLGVFTERDLLWRVVAEGRDVETTRLAEVMTSEVDTIAAEEPVKSAIRRMDEFGYRYLPVIDGDRVIGVISTRHLPFGEVLAMQWELDERHAVAERLW
ncbi:CBS domain-containing protein [Geminicoccaceae bacterium 1502E]|nr:CBS domain-containing protein [Geminicoccaceae bacterium 1502E]